MMSKVFEALPLKEDRDVLDFLLRNNSSTLEGLRVLVVDNNESTLLLTKIMLFFCRKLTY